MARESKRKRDEKRFGKPERLADMLYRLPLVCLESWPELPRGHMQEKTQQIADVANECTIVASNVAFYVRDIEGTKNFTFTDSISGAVPVRPAFFVEFREPDCERQTRHEAGLALAHLKQRGYRPSCSMLEPYLCPFCNLWHLGRKTGVELRKGLFRKGRAKERGRHYVAMDEEAEVAR